jgi:hypothetical protein
MTRLGKASSLIGAGRAFGFLALSCVAASCATAPPSLSVPPIVQDIRFVAGCWAQPTELGRRDRLRLLPGPNGVYTGLQTQYFDAGDDETTRWTFARDGSSLTLENGGSSVTYRSDPDVDEAMRQDGRGNRRAYYLSSPSQWVVVEGDGRTLYAHAVAKTPPGGEIVLIMGYMFSVQRSSCEKPDPPVRTCKTNPSEKVCSVLDIRS